MGMLLLLRMGGVMVGWLEFVKLVLDLIKAKWIEVLEMGENLQFGVKAS